VKALLLGTMLAAGAGGAGCNKGPAAPPPAAPPEVKIDSPVIREVTEYEEFTGRTEASMSVELRARVSGYVDKLHFKDGADVKKGDTLIDLDPRGYKAELERLEAQLRDNQARLERLGTEYRRVRSLGTSRAVSQEEVERISGERSQAEASVSAAKAAIKAAKLNIEFATVKAPFDGRLSRRMVDPGDSVKADDTMLTSLVAIDPIHAYFDIDERTVLRLRRLVHEGKLRSSRENTLYVNLGLADETGYPLVGVIDFVDNHLDPGTGTLRIRASLANPRKLLSPGMFVRLRLPVSLPYTAALIAEEALVSDQGQKFLYVVNAVDKEDEDKEYRVEYRKVETGQIQNGLRVVKKGLTASDWVIIEGQQRVRPNVKVTPSRVADKNRAASRRQAAPAETPPSL